jgi:hypothetical protein
LTGFVKGLIVAAIQVALVSSLGAKLLYDRATRPRLWARAAPYDPSLPIRGRYVSLQLIVEARGITELQGAASLTAPRGVILRAENQRLIAEATEPAAVYDSADRHVIFINRRGEKLAVLDQPIAFFIPEHVADPSIRPEGEQLWVEATIPKKGPPRPIRLGVKKGDGAIVPLEID